MTNLHNWQHTFRLICGCAAAALLCAGAALPSYGQGPDPDPSAAVARLSLLDGTADVTSAGSKTEPVGAVVNMPISAGQSLRTRANADAEVEFADGSVLRSTQDSSATLIRLQPETEIGLDDGLYYLELRAGTDPQFAVYAGDLSIAPTENASFRVRVRNGQPEIAVLRGAVSVTRPESYTVDVQEGESLRPDPKDGRRYLLADTVPSEPEDSWNERRAQQAADAAADQTIARQDYAGQQGYGWSDLDSSGSWYPLPGEGLVWQPYGMDAGFDPYGYGNWVYGGGGGYIWASGYSWGWLPYHCGSWGFFPNFGWGWQPAAGCRSYGGGWPVGGFPVKHPPQGWRGPRPPSSGGVVTRHPTLPVAPAEGSGAGGHLATSGRRPARPITVNGVLLQPLAPVASSATPRGNSAVGSALRRDYPVQNGTHTPLLGLESTRTGAGLQGRSGEWHAPVRVTGEAQPAVSATGVSTNGMLSAGRSGSPSAAPTPNQTAVPGWHNRMLPAAAGGTNRTDPPAIRVAPSATRPVGGATSVAAPAVPVMRTPAPAPRPITIAPAPRPVAPSSPAPHFSMPPPPPPAPAMHSSPAPAPAAPRSR